MPQDTLNLLRHQFLDLNRVLSTVMQLVTDGLQYDDETALLKYASQLLINNHNFQFCAIHTVKDNQLQFACASSIDRILNADFIANDKIDDKIDDKIAWIKTCEHLAQQILDGTNSVLIKRQAGNTVYYATPVIYRSKILATLTVNSAAIDNNHPRLISIFCHVLTGVLINSRNSQYLTQEVRRRTKDL